MLYMQPDCWSRTPGVSPYKIVPVADSKTFKQLASQPLLLLLLSAGWVGLLEPGLCGAFQQPGRELCGASRGGTRGGSQPGASQTTVVGHRGYHHIRLPQWLVAMLPGRSARAKPSGGKWRQRMSYSISRTKAWESRGGRSLSQLCWDVLLLWVELAILRRNDCA